MTKIDIVETLRAAWSRIKADAQAATPGPDAATPGPDFPKCTTRGCTP